jgi:hypothetical protein
MTAPLTHTARSGQVNCVRTTDVPGQGILIDSDIDSNDGQVLVTYGEFVHLVEDMKAGGFDEMYTHAKANAGTLV